MWKFFLPKKKSKPAGWSVMDSVLQLTATTQRRCSGWMNRKTQHWTPGQTKLYLLVLCLAGVCGGVFMIWESFSARDHTVVVPVGSMPVLPIMMQSPDLMLSEDDTASIFAFSRYLDSLQQTSEGKKLYDQLVADRPGLIDSLATTKQYLSK